MIKEWRNECSRKVSRILSARRTEPKNLADKILITYGGISQKDYDDFYSVANETVAKAILGYDNTRNFDTYIYSCIANKIKTEMTRRNRLKRMADRTSVSIDIVKCPQKTYKKH